MNKTRLEAFSDGVFAIVITILILEIRIPEVDVADLPKALYGILPNILAYLMSFGVIAVYWVGHHQSFHLIAKVDGGLLWLNILLLLSISIIPFPTSLLGHYPNEPLPIVLYAANLLATNAISLCMVFYLHRHRHLANVDMTKYMARSLWVYAIVNGLYVIAIALSFFVPLASYIIFFVVLAAVVVYYARYQYGAASIA